MRLGRVAFNGVYSLVSFALFVPLVYIWWTNRHTGPLLWWLRSPTAVHIADALTVLGFFFIFGAFARPVPASFVAPFLPKTDSPRGLVTVTSRLDA